MNDNTPNRRRPRAAGFVAALMVATSLSGCNLLTRLSEIGGTPQTTPIRNPTTVPGYRPVSMPMPAPQVAEDNPNSLWRAGARAFFKDTRAKTVGDIVTIKLSVNDSATTNNKTERTRADTEDTDATALIGLQAEFSKKLPQAISPTALTSLGNALSTKGEGKITRSEAITLTFAAVITQILPNGNFAVIGRQEIVINKEIRELMVTGIVRPEDIEADNTVTHDKIAEMRAHYGGRGTASDLQTPRWGWQVIDVLFPF
jgi:flagellar L-ring protein precursor FlgH